MGGIKWCRRTGRPRGGSTRIIPSRTVGPAWMVPWLAAGEAAEESVVIITVVEGTLAAMEIVMVVSVAVGAKRAGEAPAEAGEVVEAEEVV